MCRLHGLCPTEDKLSTLTPCDFAIETLCKCQGDEWHVGVSLAGECVVVKKGVHYKCRANTECGF